MNYGLLGQPIGGGQYNRVGLLGLPLGKLGRIAPPVVVQAGQDTSDTSGATLTTGGASSKGSYVEMSSGLERPVDGFYLACLLGGGAIDYLIDIAVGPANQEEVILANFPFGSGSASLPGRAYIPLKIPGGSRVAARCQASSAANTVEIIMQFVRGDYARALSFERATTYGADTSDSGGTSVDPGGSANGEGTWTTISASIENRIRYAIACYGNARNNTIGVNSRALFDFGFGPVGSEQLLVEGLIIQADTAADRYTPLYDQLMIDVPAGERLVARQQNNNTDATDRLVDMTIIGFDR